MSIPPESGPGSARRRLIFFGVSGLALLGIVAVFRGVLIPFLLAIIVAYVLAPLVAGLGRVLPRWIAVVIIYLGLLGALSAFLALGVPRLAVEVDRLAAEGPRIVKSVRDDWVPRIEAAFRDATSYYTESSDRSDPEVRDEPRPIPRGSEGAIRSTFDAGVGARSSDSIAVVPDRSGGYAVHLPPGGIAVRQGDERTFRIGGEAPPTDKEQDFTTALSDALRAQTDNTQGYAVTLLKTAQTIVQAVVRGVFTFFLMLMISAYLLITSDRILAFLRSLVQVGKESQFDRLIGRIDKGLSGVVRGQLLIALVNGVLSGIGFYLFELKYWPILTLIATVLSIIPIFGSIISTIPAVLIALQNGFGTALLVLLWIVGIHQLEANILNPKIMGDAAKVHPVLVVFALLAGEHLFGIVGALLAVPTLSIAQSIFLHFREVSLGVETPASPATTG